MAFDPEEYRCGAPEDAMWMLGEREQDDVVGIVRGATYTCITAKTTPAINAPWYMAKEVVGSMYTFVALLPFDLPQSFPESRSSLHAIPVSVFARSAINPRSMIQKISIQRLWMRLTLLCHGFGWWWRRRE